MSEDDKYSEVIKEITKKTNQGEMDWSTYDVESVEDIGPSAQPDDGFRTTYAEKELRIYRVRKEGAPRDVELDSQTLELTWETEKTTQTTLKLVDPDSGEEWKFPSLSIINDLYFSLKQEQEAPGVQGWVQEWMSSVLTNRETST